MNDLQSTLALAALFALRCVAPLVITLAIGYLMNRLVERWQVEDEAALANKSDTVADSRDIAPSAGSVTRLPVVTVPCWILRNCDPIKQSSCPARNQPGLPCWLVRLKSEGRLASGCPDCPLYNEALPQVAVVT